MMDVTLSLLALIAGGFTVELYAAARAPLGYQDEQGFNYGSDLRPGGDDSEGGNPS